MLNVPKDGNIRDLIHVTNPYDDLNLTDHEFDLQGWNSKHEIFAKVIKETQAEKVIEVGSWKGASALHMLTIKSTMHILCIDTWLGALEMWEDKSSDDRYKSLKLINGYPSIYYTFLKNVKKSNAENFITPFPVPSNIAYRFLRQIPVQWDLIYIDGSHDYVDVGADIQNYSSLLRPGGIIFGDDYENSWPDVMRAVDDYVKHHDSQLEIFDKKWIIRY
jgi:predicted O-methyltransferase YrrM